MFQALPLSLMVPHDEEKPLKKRKTSKSRKQCNERNTTFLTGLMEKRSSLWDMCDSEYKKREEREVAYKENVERLVQNWILSEISSDSIT